MTRDEVLRSYDVDKDGRIVSPGQFEGEPIFGPHFWDLAMQGFSDTDDGGVYRFRFKNGCDDFKEWPELKRWLGRKRSLKLWQDGQGFVYCR